MTPNELVGHLSLPQVGAALAGAYGRRNGLLRSGGGLTVGKWIWEHPSHQGGGVDSRSKLRKRE